MKTYSLSKCKKIFEKLRQQEKRRRDSLSLHEQKELAELLSKLESAIFVKDKQAATSHAKQAEAFYEKHLKKTAFEWTRDLGLALIIALVVATIVRQMWLELYEIPSGSMRPTFREEDRLSVTKTQFGLNIPLTTGHFYFNPDLVDRTGVTIFTAENLPVIESDTMYFGIFPAKKRLVKRMIAKPGDTIYFYGGKIYGIDKEGNPLEMLQNAPQMQSLEHIPFSHFVEDIGQKDRAYELGLYHLPLVRLPASGLSTLRGEIFNGKEWIPDTPTSKPHDTVQTYSDLFGIKNFALARIISSNGPTPDYALQMTFGPRMNQVEVQGKRFVIGTQEATIPLSKTHLEKIAKAMYTARFIVKDEMARQYPYPNKQQVPKISLPDVPDGTYEVYHGKAFRVDWGGTLFELDKDHPLYKQTPKLIQTLFNSGIHLMNNPYETGRYAYFREGELYLMGNPIFEKQDPTLKKYLATVDQQSPLQFKDFGPPPNAEYIKTFGLKIPEGSYLLLGDNHAMSQDCRSFGFVPEANLQGRPSLIFWPFGERWGFMKNSPYAIFVTPRLIIWTIAGIIFLLWYFVYQKRRTKV